MIECVPNVSEGRDEALVAALARTCDRVLLDVHSDADHHRSVFTLAGSAGELGIAVRALAAECVTRLDLRRHDGVHPRLGVLDVVPFVPLDPGDHHDAMTAALGFAEWLGSEHAVPVFLYDGAALGAGDSGAARTLPAVRRGAFGALAPDFGPPRPHPTAGATAVSVRAPLVALNCELSTDDIGVATTVAAAVRESGGGLPGVRALGLPLRTKGRAQVSMNLVDLATTGLEAAVDAVRAEARAHGADVEEVELVGLMPAAAFDACSVAFREWAGIDAWDTIEGRAAGRRPREGTGEARA